MTRIGTPRGPRPLVYIAGPYSKPDPCANTYEAVQTAERLLVRFPDIVPVIPHLAHFWHTMRPHPYEFWLDLDLEVLRRCDVLYRMAGESSGADGEVAYAEELGIKVVTSPSALSVWLYDVWWAA